MCGSHGKHVVGQEDRVAGVGRNNGNATVVGVRTEMLREEDGSKGCLLLWVNLFYATGCGVEGLITILSLIFFKYFSN